jgi:hypothetical protein
MRPLQGAVLAREDGTWTRRLIDHDHRSMTAASQLDSGRVAAALLADPDWIALALTAGTPVLVIAGDPARVCSKYGNRGLGYMYLEAGAALQHATLLAREERCQVRPIGGFCEGLIADILGAPELLPLITALVVPDG